MQSWERLTGGGPDGPVVPNEIITPRQRAAVSVVSLALFGWTVVGIVAGWAPLREVCGVLFAIVGLGTAPLQRLQRVAISAYAALSVAISLSLLVVLATAMVEVGWWHPVPVLTVCALAAVAMHVDMCRRFMLTPPAAVASSSRRQIRRDAPADVATGGPLRRLLAIVRRSESVSILWTAVGTTLWLAGALTTRHVVVGPRGLLASLPVIWFVGVACVLLGFATARRDREWQAAVAVFCLLGAVTATPAIIYDAPRYHWSSKHLGVVDYIRVHGAVDARIDIYHSWPGLFAGVAALADALRLPSLIGFAMWWSTAMGVFRLIAFRFLAGRFVGSGYRCWLGALLYVLADSIAQDYFSPQAIGVVFVLLVFGLAVWPSDGLNERARLLLIFLASSAVAVTHQLSPYFLVLGVGALVVFRLARPWWIPALVGAPAATWALWHQRVVSRFVPSRGVGSVGNIVPKHNLSDIFNHPRVAAQVTALMLGCVLLAVTAVIAAVRQRDRGARGLAACAASPAAVLVVTAYGNEGILRVALFALPWLAMLAVRPWSGRRLRRLGGVKVVAALLLVCYLVASFTLEWEFAGRKDEWQAVRLFENSAPSNSVIMYSGSTTGPSRSTARYPDFYWLARGGYVVRLHNRYDPALDLQDLTRRLVVNWPAPAYFLLVDDTIKAHGDSYGPLDAAEYDAFAGAVSRSPNWRPVFTERHTVLYRMTRYPPGALAERRASEAKARLTPSVGK
ncbi:MAG: hypothetical protein JWL83_1328 [Actinomycetia bacterium]|nr:hypothetical protein [Actinomycetes bacterium]